MAEAAGFVLPGRYSVTHRYMALRVCERMGLPHQAFAALDPADRAELLAFEIVRQAEEARERCAWPGRSPK